MKLHSVLVKSGLLLVGWIGVSVGVWADCRGPQVLEAKLLAHADADTYAELGNWFGDKRQYGCAAEAFRAALKLEPDSARLSYLLGLSLYSAGNAEEAVGPLQQSLLIAPNVLKPHLILGAAFAQLQRNGEAKAEWQDALKIDPHSKVALDGLSKSLIVEENYASVIALLRSAPRNEDLNLDLAQAYGKAKMFDDAAKILRAALLINPSSWRLTNALTIVLVNQVHYQEALRLSRKYARLHPRDIQGQKLYLRVLVLNSDLAQAQPLARRLLATSPHDSDFLYLNGVLESQAGQFAAARDHLQEAVVLDPSHYNARYNLGIVLTELKDFRGAREQLEKAIELGATEPEIRFKFANVLRNLGETQLAQEQLKLYQQQLQENASRALSISKAAQADRELETGDPHKAEILYREAVAASPKDALLAYKLATALDRTGDTVAERAALEQAIQIDPDMAIAQNQLGYLASRGGDSAAAEEHFRQAVRAAPGFTEAWVNLAATLGMESRFSEAREAVASALKLDPKNADALQLRQELGAAQANH